MQISLIPLAVVSSLLVLPVPFSAKHFSGVTRQVVDRSLAINSDAINLEPKVPIARQLAGGELHVYRLSLEAGQYLHLVVNQQGIDVVVILSGPDGKQLVMVDSPNEAHGPEPVSLIAETSGNYRLEVRSLHKTTATGRYQVKIEKIGLPLPQDKSRIAAERGFMQGEQLRLQDRKTSWQQALHKYLEALSIFKALGLQYWEALTLESLGSIDSRLGETQKAINDYKLALQIHQTVGDSPGNSDRFAAQVREASILNTLGYLYFELGEKKQALTYYNEALQAFRSVSNTDRTDLSLRTGEAIVLNRIGRVYASLGEKQKALWFYNLALPIYQIVGERTKEAATLSYIGEVYEDIGQYQKALAVYNQALPIARQVGDASEEAAILTNIGVIYQGIGQLQRALGFYNQALPVTRKVLNRSGEGTILNNIGTVSRILGQPQKALLFFNAALPIVREIHNQRTEAAVLHNIGAVYEDIGQTRKALEYYTQALPIRQQVHDRLGEATTLNNLGEVYRKMGEFQKALAFFNLALPIRQEVLDRVGEAITLSNIAAIDQAISQPTAAITNYEKAVKTILEVRASLQRENRQKFLQNYRGDTVALINLLLDQNQAARAYEWVNLFTTADLADYSRLINAKVANLEAQKALDQWNQKNQLIERLRNLLDIKYDLAIVQRLNELQAEVNKQAEEIFHRFPEVAELFETTPQDIAQLRASIPTGTVILHPVLLTGITNVPNSIALFVLTKNKLTVTKHQINLQEFDTLVTNYPTKLKTRSIQLYKDASQQLYDILIRPVEKQISIASPTQLSIIATEKLRYFPFETLYDHQTQQYLIQKYPVNNLTRLSIRSLQKLEEIHKTSLNSVLAIGNPFPQDQRLQLVEAQEEVASIKQLLPGSQIYVGKQATLKAFKTQAPRFGLLHIATHGCFQQGGCPNLGMEENTLLFADQNLNIADIALLGLKETTLVTLSACQTAVEANSNGEEIAGIAYLFERAGAKAVIASLWSVDDESTKILMTAFYQNLKKGMSKGQALRQAKLSLLNTHPYYWSPFILIGNAS